MKKIHWLRVEKNRKMAVGFFITEVIVSFIID